MTRPRYPHRPCGGSCSTNRHLSHLLPRVHKHPLPGRGNGVPFDNHRRRIEWHLVLNPLSLHGNRNGLGLPLQGLVDRVATDLVIHDAEDDGLGIVGSCELIR